MPDRGEARPLCFVLDTNQWANSQLMRDPVSASLLYALTTTGSKIGFPQVIEREVMKHGLRLGVEAREAIQKGFRAVRALTGQAPDPELPSDEALHSAVTDRIAALEPLLVRVEFTQEHAVRALDRIDEKRAPARAGQQFKDSAIWEACLDLGRDFDIHLVTADKAFFQRGDHKQGLDAGLEAECAAAGIKCLAHASLEEALGEIAENIAGTFDPVPVIDGLEDEVRRQASDSAERAGVELGARGDFDVEAFVTETHTVLAVTFSVVFDVLDAEDGRYVGTATAGGQAKFDTGDGSVSDVRLGTLTIDVVERDGQEAQHATVFGWGASTIGTRQVPHVVRAPLPGGGTYSELRGSS